MKNEVNGWDTAWAGPKDYRCNVCHMGFTPDEFVFIHKGFPFHEFCVDRLEFDRRISNGGSPSLALKSVGAVKRGFLLQPVYLLGLKNGKLQLKWLWNMVKMIF